MWYAASKGAAGRAKMPVMDGIYMVFNVLRQPQCWIFGKAVSQLPTRLCALQQALLAARSLCASMQESAGQSMRQALRDSVLHLVPPACDLVLEAVGRESTEGRGRRECLGGLNAV